MIKSLIIWFLSLIIFLLVIFYPIYGYVLKSALESGRMMGTPIGNISISISNFPKNLYYSLKSFTSKEDRIENSKNLKDGLSFKKKINLNNTLAFVEKVDKETDYKYIELLDPNTQKLLHTWKLSETQINNFFKGKSFSKIKTLKGINDPSINLNDGSIVFKFEGEETKYLAKINVKSNIEWIISDSQSDEFYLFHHSLETDADGNIYSPIIMERPHWLSEYIKSDGIFHGQKNSYADHGYVKISKDGKILEVVSLTDILIDNGLGIFIYGVGPLETDAIHLNDVEPALFDGIAWKKNDLLMSARNLSLVFLYRPSEKKIIWYKFGPWIMQHDPDFINDKEISIFGNDIITYHYNRYNRFNLERNVLINDNKKNNIWIHNFENDKTYKLFENAIDKSNFVTWTQGSSYYDGNNFLSNSYDNMGVTEFYYDDEIVGNFVQFSDKKNIYLVSGISFLKYENYPNWLNFED